MQRLKSHDEYVISVEAVEADNGSDADTDSVSVRQVINQNRSVPYNFQCFFLPLTDEARTSSPALRPNTDTLTSTPCAPS